MKFKKETRITIVITAGVVILGIVGAAVYGGSEIDISSIIASLASFVGGFGLGRPHQHD